MTAVLRDEVLGGGGGWLLPERARREGRAGCAAVSGVRGAQSRARPRARAGFASQRRPHPPRRLRVQSVRKRRRTQPPASCAAVRTKPNRVLGGRGRGADAAAELGAGCQGSVHEGLQLSLPSAIQRIKVVVAVTPMKPAEHVHVTGLLLGAPPRGRG